jgi:hypothetical protein
MLEPKLHKQRLTGSAMRRGVVVVLGVGLVTIGVAIVLVLSHRPLVAIGSNGISAKNYVELEEKGALSNCQTAGTIPAGTSAIRLAIEGVYFSPTVTVEIAEAGHVIARGAHAPGGPATPNVTVAVAELTRTVRHAKICVAVGPTVGPIRFSGVPSGSSAHVSNPLQQAVLRVEYLRAGHRSWQSSLSTIAHRIGLGRAPDGGWVAWLALVLALTVTVLALRLALEELR